MKTSSRKRSQHAIANQQLDEGKRQSDGRTDSRLISNGWEIPSEFYTDQPYLTKTDDGAWLCVMTTGAGREGQVGQHVVSLRSLDQGRSWDAPVAIESCDGPEASWAVPLKAPNGRIYVFYIHNTDNIRELKADNPPYSTGYTKRMDSFGYYVFKYSDDHGRSWSQKRYTIPVREFEIDRNNVYGGKIRFFWNTGKPITHENIAYLPIHKVGGFGCGWFTSSEGALLRSDNLLTEIDPEKINWETLPDGDIGLGTPLEGGPVAEEQSFSVLSDGTLYCVYRTIDGYPACTYSYDGGHTWTAPQYKSYPDGRHMKHPRAANFAWRNETGKFLYWFHNHGGRFIGEHPQRRTISYEDRNPVWLCGGVEEDTPRGKRIKWSQPDIVLYDDDPYIRMSYPDLIENDGKHYLSETQKFVARLHEVDPVLLDGLWHQFDSTELVTQGLVLDLPGTENMPSEVVAPLLPRFTERDNMKKDYGTRDLRSGFSVEARIRFDSLEPGQILVDSRNDSGAGFCLITSCRETIEIILNDGRTENCWDCDSGLLRPGQTHHIVAIVDGGPKIILYVVDGRLCDGGEFRQFGWGRYSPNLRDIHGSETLRIGEGIESLRIYNRALRVAEAVVNFQSGK